MSFTSFSHGGSDRHADNVDNSRSRHSQWGHWGGARRIPSSVAGWQGVGVAALDCPKVRQGAGILDRERYTYGFSGRPLLWLLIDYVCSQCSAAPSACLGVVREQQSPNSGAGTNEEQVKTSGQGCLTSQQHYFRETKLFKTVIYIPGSFTPIAIPSFTYDHATGASLTSVQNLRIDSSKMRVEYVYMVYTRC